MRKLQAFFHRVKPKRILDVATGNGSFIHLVSRIYDDYDYILGVDTQEKGIKKANETFEDTRIHFRNEDIFALEEEPFDVIMVSNSLHHFADLDKLFEHLEQYLAPNGYIVINEMVNDQLSKAQKSHMKLHHWSAEIDRHMGKVHNETMASKEILQTLQKVSSKKIFDAWDMVYPVEHSTSEEDLKSINETIDRLVEKIEDEQFRKEMTSKADKVKKYIHKKGFQLATQMLVIMGEKL